MSLCVRAINKLLKCLAGTVACCSIDDRKPTKSVQTLKLSLASKICAKRHNMMKLKKLNS